MSYLKFCLAFAKDKRVSRPRRYGRTQYLRTQGMLGGIILVYVFGSGKCQPLTIIFSLHPESQHIPIVIVFKEIKGEGGKPLRLVGKIREIVRLSSKWEK